MISYGCCEASNSGRFQIFASKWIKKSGIFATVGSEMTTLFCWYQSSKWPILTHTFPRWGSLRCPKSLYPLLREWYKRFWVVLRCQAWRYQCNRFWWNFWLNGCFWDHWSSCNGGLVDWFTRSQNQYIMGHQGATTIILHLVFTCSLFGMSGAGQKA